MMPGRFGNGGSGSSGVDGVVNTSTKVLGTISGSPPSRFLNLSDNGSSLAGSSRQVYDWCVDSVNGNDTNSGKTPAAALASLAKLLTVLTANKKVGLARGSKFRETYDLSAGGVNLSGVVTEAYGQGDPPIIDGSLVIPNGSFSLTSGAVYQATVAPTIVDNAAFVSVWENDVRYTCVASVAACQATPGTYTTSYIAAGTIASLPPSGSPSSFTVYVHTLDGSSPISNGKTYEYSGVNFNYRDKEDGTCLIRGVWCRRNMSNNGSARFYGQFLDGRITEGGKHNAIMGQGAVLARTDLYDAYYAGQGLSMLEFFDPSATGNGNALVDDCRFYLNKNVAANDYTGGAMGSHEGGSTSYGTFSILNSAISGFNGSGGISMSMTGCQEVIVAGCDIKDCAIGIQNYSTTSVVGCSIETQSLCVDIHTAVPVSVRSSTLTTTSGSGFQTALNIFNIGVPSMIVEDCVFLSNTLNSIGINGVANRMTVKRCTFTTTYSVQNVPILSGQGAGQIVVIDENVFPNGLTNTFVTDTTGTLETITTYRTNSGQESGSGEFPVVALSASFTLIPSQSVIVYTGAAGNTLTLPTAVGIRGKIFTVKNSGSGSVTLATTSAQTIFNTSAVTTITMAIGDKYRVQSDGANWHSI